MPDAPSDGRPPAVVTVGEVRVAGRAIDLRERLAEPPAAARLLAAIRGVGDDDDDAGDGPDRVDPPDDDCRLRVDWPGREGGPAPVHEHVGRLAPGPSLDLRAGLAAAARSRGETAPEADALAAARERLASHDPPDLDVETVERRAAEAGAAERELRERVATLRGRLTALRETHDPGNDGDEPGPDAIGASGAADSSDAAGGGGAGPGGADDDPVAAAAASYREAIRRLSEAETRRIAARQRLETLRDRLRSVRDARRRRMELQDRVANLERAARRSLAAAVYDEFAAAVAAIPGPGDAGDEPGAYEGPPETALLALARVAAVDAPLVLVDGFDRFPNVETAATRLDATVIATAGADG